MKALVVADVHYSLRQLDWVAKRARDFDLVILAGDLLDLSASTPREVQIIAVLKYLKRLAATTRVIASSGNHDLDDEIPGGEAIADWLQIARRNGVYIDGESLDLGGVHFTVCPWWDGPAMRGQVGLQLEQEAERRPERWVWVYHAPPAGSPVSFTRKGSAGDPFLRELIERYRPELVLCGHIHNAPFYAGGSWHDRIGPTWVFNAGRQLGNRPTHIEIDFDARTARWSSIENEGTLDLAAAAETVTET